MEIIGKEQLQQKTLKDIGLVSGKALLRLLNKRESEDQAHVYVPQERKPKLEESTDEHINKKISKISPDNSITIKHPIIKEKNSMNDEPMDTEMDSDDVAVKTKPIDKIKCLKNLNDINTSTNKKTISNEDLEHFKNSISYLDDRDTLIFNIMDGTSVLYQDEGDDFFEPTVKDVNLVLRDLKNSRIQFEDGQLSTSAMREIEKAQNILNLLHKYNKCIIRIHFPNRLVLQTVFKPTETILDIFNFIRKYLIDESLDFFLFTTPPKTILKPEDTLLECGCVPSAMIHFSCGSEIDHYLKPELKEKVVTACQASIAAYLVRKERIANCSNNESSHNTEPGPSRTFDDQRQQASSSQQNNTTANSGKTPKWFKPK
ncbi:Hypothetical protein CINCED_3A012952 [Cinara cedri]|nr:Hypothetical protein CINCED_3A012952 [Cinara cedri]